MPRLEGLLEGAWARLARAAPIRSAVNAGFHAYARRRVDQLAHARPVMVQEQGLLRLVRRARDTRFGRDHGFASIDSVNRFKERVPLRTFEELWSSYLVNDYPNLRGITWPDSIPYLALTSGTTQGPTKHIPVSRAMLRANTLGAKTMIAYYLVSRPQSRLFGGKLFMLGGSTDLAEAAPGVRAGDLSGIAAEEAGWWLRPFAFPPPELALVPDWDQKLNLLAERSSTEPITLVGGVPSWLLLLFQALLQRARKETLVEVWPFLEVIVHGGVRFDPYREAFRRIVGSDQVQFIDVYACSEGFVAFTDPVTGLLRLMFDHGIFYEFVPVDELGSERPARHWLLDLQVGVNYAIVVSTCAGLWAHVVGDTVRFESVRPPLLTFTGRTKYSLSAFGEHLINEEVECAMAAAAAATGASVRDWHVGPVFQGALGHHLYVLEFLTPPADLAEFRRLLDAELCRRNADYQAHRAEGVGLPMPALIEARAGGLELWMRARGKLGGQHKLPRMDSEGQLTRDLTEFLRQQGAIARALPPS